MQTQSKPSEVWVCISSAHKRDTTAVSRNMGGRFSVWWCVCPLARGAESEASAVMRCASPRQFLGFGERGWWGQGFARVRLQLVNGGVGDGFEAVGLGLAAPCPEASTLALRLAELLNRVADLSFFRFCYIGRQEKQTKRKLGELDAPFLRGSPNDCFPNKRPPWKSSS